MGAKIAQGEFLCLPSDDSYYVPKFAEKMLNAAAQNSWDWVYCDIVYDERCGHGRYTQVETLPRLGWIDKMSFILRRNKFPGFPNKPDRDEPSCCDGHLAEELVVNPYVRHGKVMDCLGVHN